MTSDTTRSPAATAALGALVSSVISSALWLLATSFLFPELALGGITGAVIFGVLMFAWMFGFLWWTARHGIRATGSR